MALLLQIFQDVVDRRAALDVRAQTLPGTVVRVRTRGVECTFGRLRVPRLAYSSPGQATEFPADKILNLPVEVYSLPVREQVAREATATSFAQVTEGLDQRGGAHVPKRQVEQLVARAARDVDAFYQTTQGANDAVSEGGLLVLTADSKGVTMRPESLREATRKTAEALAQKVGKTDPMAPKKKRKHDKRMALVAAVYEQEPFPRTAEQVVRRLRARNPADKVKPPPVEHKQVRASLEKGQKRGIAELFEEADRRDPERVRTTVVLVDGEKWQLRQVQRQARQFGRPVTTIVDIIHVLHYLWGAANALCGKQKPQAEAWVQLYLHKLLLAKTAFDVAAGIRQAATLRGVARGESKEVDDCIRYLRNHARWLHYREALDQGFPIATGVIEGACRHLVQDRMGITGAKWSLSGAEAVLKLRAVSVNGDWAAYWRFHEHREKLRNYPQKAAL
jgi:hypothetical protein